jgi:hypothetical protein
MPTIGNNFPLYISLNFLYLSLNDYFSQPFANCTSIAQFMFFELKHISGLIFLFFFDRFKFLLSRQQSFGSLSGEICDAINLTRSSCRFVRRRDEQEQNIT